LIANYEQGQLELFAITHKTYSNGVTGEDKYIFAIPVHDTLLLMEAFGSNIRQGMHLRNFWNLMMRLIQNFS
jgi:hypothetical protein